MLSTLSSYMDQLTLLLTQHQQWVAPATFLLAFVKSLPFVALLIPGTAMLLSIGALIGAGDIHFVPVWVAVSVGAGLGDWVSFWLGQRYGPNIFSFDWARKRLHLYTRAQEFFMRWGWVSIVVCRFIGPLRATVPLIAGTCGMKNSVFQFANWISAFMWASALLLPGWLSFQVF